MEKRPLAVVGILYTVTLASAVRIVPQICCVISIMSAIIGGLFYFLAPKYRRKLVLIFVPIALGFAVMSLCTNYYEGISVVTNNKTCNISGEIVDVPRKNYGRWYYVIKTDNIDIEGVPQNIKLRLSCRESIEAKEGDKIFGQITFISAKNDTGIENASALRADGISAKAYCSPYIEMYVSESDFTIRYLPQKIRRSMISCIRKTMPERYSGMLCAMLLGDTSYISDDVAENFRTAGISHLLAVSGFHVSLIVNSVAFLLLKLKFMPRPRYFTEIAVILLFMAVTGFTPSVVRAGIMHIMSIIAMIIRRDADSLTSLSLSLIIMCTINPMSAADIGLQMSALSTISIILFSDGIYKIIDRRIPLSNNKFILKIRNYFISTLAVSLTTSICTMPLSAIYFGKVSLIAPLTNVLCVHVGAQFITLGTIASLLRFIPIIGSVLAFIPKSAALIFGVFVDGVTAFLSSLPLAYVNASYDFIAPFIAMATAIILTAYVFFKTNDDKALRRKIILAVFFGISALLLVGMVTNQQCISDSEIIVFGQNSGSVCVMAKKGTHAIISEAGGESYDMINVNDVMNRCGVQCIDAVVVSQDTEQRSGIADELIDKFSPKYAALGGDGNYAYAKRSALKNGTEIIPFENEISDKSMGLSVKMFIDTQNNCWQLLSSGNLTVLVCPNDGDCSLIPDLFRSCDAVVIGEGGVKNVICLNVGAAIVAADKQSNEIAAVLRVKGIDKVYQTIDGTFRLKVKKNGLYLLRFN